MDTLGAEREIQQFTKQLIENFNMVFAMALDEKQSFEGAVEKLYQLTGLLEQFGCGDTACEQLLNFAKIAFFRERYGDAMDMALKAEEKCSSAEKKKEIGTTAHDMAYKLLEMGLSSQSDQGLLALAEKRLSAEDYVLALKRAVEGGRDSAGFIKLLSMELLRQGIAREKDRPQEAIYLLRTACPYLNEKRAALVKKEIAALEERKNG